MFLTKVFLWRSQLLFLISHITDHVVVAFEIIHLMKKNKRNVHDESNIHIFFDCRKSHACWKHQNFKDFFPALITNLDG